MFNANMNKNTSAKKDATVQAIAPRAQTRAKKPSVSTYEVDASNYFYDCQFIDLPPKDKASDIKAGMTLYKDTTGELVPWDAMGADSCLFIAAKKYNAGDDNVHVIYAGKVKKEFIQFNSGDWTTSSAGQTALEAFLSKSQILPI